MNHRPYETKEFWTGAIYLSVSGAAFVVARDYAFGSPGSMGPGFFPSIVAGLLFLVGAIILGRALLVGGHPAERLAFRAIILVVLGTIAFGFLIRTAGLLVALPALILLSASASREFRLDAKAILGVVLLVAFCAGVFTWGLGVPMPLVGPWLQSLGVPAIN